MRAVEFVIQKMSEFGVHGKINGKHRELILRQFKRDRAEMGLRLAQAALEAKLESIAKDGETCG